jgi:nitrous oxide reductase accessory protein NosL
VQELILENERRRGWLIFYSHDVRSMPSRYGCTPDLLRFAVSFASQRGGRILKISDVVAELVSQSNENEHCSIDSKNYQQQRHVQSVSGLSRIEGATLM